ncbi:MAG: tetratricopeptide repeat protein, partial [Actinomycetota bacterium]|nr:tetratricopeptide repeat protein [Actinomycetota bacterium]
MLSRLGDRWAEALSAQRSILRETFDAHGGHEMGTEGDSFFVVFPSAQHALLASLEGQRRLQQHAWPDNVPLRVRMGLHTGEPDRHEDGYIGMDVHRAARIAATAHGGQTVMSAATQALVGRHPVDVEVRDLGWHRLKDIDEPEHLYDVVAPGLADAFPPLRSLGSEANLPAYATELIGRPTELAEIADAIGQHNARLVTLTGAGGTGKTRLAVAVASELQDRFPGAIFFVPLHTADRSALMWSGIAETVGAPAEVERSPDERARRFLRDRTALLVLDNLEQIVDADVVVSQLLNGAPQVRILTTSRRPLHLVDEHEYPVSALAVPAGGTVDRYAAERAGAVSLFVRRARMVRPGFSLTDDNVTDVVALCRRLDGLPLAIELAAGRSRLLSPRALLSRIDHRLGEGVTGSDRTERQRTLGATIAWSYDLLDEADQRIFRRLGVFSSVADLDAIEYVVGAESGDPLDVVAHLVDVSLLQIVEAPAGEPVVSMLETIRQFARERLKDTEESDEMRLRHARWCLQVANEIGALLHGPSQMSALDRMDAVEEDIRAALDWCLDPAGEFSTERRECGYALLAPMDTYWYRFGYAAEGRGWHDRALRIVESGDDGDSVGLLDSLHGMGILAVQQGDLVPGAEALERALEMARRLGDVDREARESNSLGIARREAGDLAGARRLIERSMSLARQVENPQREATALANLVILYVDSGEYAAAVDAARKAVAADHALGDPWGVAISQGNLILALLYAEGPHRAHEHLVDVATDAVALGDTELSIGILESFATVMAGLGHLGRAASLLGAAEHHRELSGIPRTAPDQGHLDRFIGPARQSLSTQEWERAYTAGKAMSLEAAVAAGLATQAVSR